MNADKPAVAEGGPVPSALTVDAPLHTPGPWFLSAEQPDGTWELRVGSPDGAWLLRLSSIDGTETERAEDDANARLAAAAPEHHEASLSTVERLADLPRFLREENNRALAEIVEEELAKHRAAIAKATGSAA